MKIKNLEINKKPIGKLASFVLAGTIAMTTLTWCGSNKNALKGTVLNKTYVVTFDDGSKDIAKQVKYCDACKEAKTKFGHYKSIISANIYKTNECANDGHDWRHYERRSIVDVEDIGKYLTSDELEKSLDRGLTYEYVNNIISRIMESAETYESKTQSKTK